MFLNILNLYFIETFQYALQQLVRPLVQLHRLKQTVTHRMIGIIVFHGFMLVPIHIGKQMYQLANHFIINKQYWDGIWLYIMLPN